MFYALSYSEKTFSNLERIQLLHGYSPVRETLAAPLGRRRIEVMLTNDEKRQVEAELDVDDDLSLLELSLFLDSLFFGSLFDSDEAEVFELPSLLDSDEADFEPLSLFDSPLVCPLRA